MVAFPIDSVADAAIAARTASAAVRTNCDLCGHAVASDVDGRGLYIWSRGDERRYEEPPLCDKCAMVVSISAEKRFRREEEEDE